ncbi:MAG TPA: hypothetical protein VMQ73_15155 [Methylomirabilota bacterium]|nr:hypothetical protein [Methylomirabilota bacterium]
MRTTMIAGLLATLLAVPAAQAMECATFASGEALCDDGSYAYYFSPETRQWQTLDRNAVAAALAQASNPAAADAAAAQTGNGGEFHDGNGGSVVGTGNGCVMLSSPGYSFGSSIDFASSGC